MTGLDTLAETMLRRHAAAIVISTQYASVRALQTRLKLGHPAAAELMAVLEERGIVGPAQDRVPSRAVLVRAEHLDSAIAAEFPLPAGLQGGGA